MSGYSLGVDVGTTYSAAAISRHGASTIVELGSRSASMPSVVFLRDDGSILVGEAAQRRASSQPDRVAREFKRRIGDPTPLLLGGTPYSAEALIARLLASIVEHVVEREGGWPDSIAITHPANWGPFKIDLLGQAVRLAGLDDHGAPVTLMTEPGAAVRHYASHERVDTGSVLAVYDLGGGTFDAALLRKSDDPAGTAFEPLGRPEGIERLGGIDFDAAVLGHVVRSLGGVVEELDDEDPGTLQALARLRQECVEAKEALSSDTEASVPVLLPNVQTEVRLTRSEFEAMIRPSLADSLQAMRRTLASADVSPDDVSAVLLVGGSSRVPMVAQLVSNEFGRPVAVDADPKHAIALGAAAVAAELAASRVEAEPTPAETPTATMPETSGVATDGDPATVMPFTAPPSGHDEDRPPGATSRTPIYLGIAAAAAALAVTGAIVLSGSGGGDSPDADAAPVATDVVDSIADTTVAPLTTDAVGSVADTTVAPETTIAPTTTVDPATLPTVCPTGPPAVACVTDIDVADDGGLVATYETFGFVPELEPASDHLHFYFDSVIDGDEINAGSAGSGGDWRIWDTPNPFAATGGDQGRTGYTIDDARLLGAASLCVLVADVNHAVYEGTGNCIAIPGL